ncbi:MAG: Nudix family hydrolase [Gammaproteobacteria bacterium]|nr:Nudix family hydrolase [Gammaproteobacteria bacterium]
MRSVHVAVAVIQDENGRILLSRRADHAHQGGLWEFPGGKLDPQETLQHALKREIREELGIDVHAYSPLIRINHSYPDRRVLLDVHRVTAFSGVPSGREGQPLVWVDPESMHAYPMPAADLPIVTALRLPDSYLITGRDFSDKQAFVERFRERLAEGLRLIQFRAPGMEPHAFLKMAEELVDLCRAEGARLLLNATPELTTVCGADGVHLTSRRLMSLDRRPLSAGQWVAASCHNLIELRHAQEIGVDFAVLSPVLATASHPEAEPLGWQRFMDLVEQVNIPVYALGGLLPQMIGQAREYGGQGIAAIHGLWR